MSSQSSQCNPCAKRPGDWGFEPAKVCGCHSSIICKHYYANMRAAILADADRHTTEETEGGLLGGPPQQTYFNIWRGSLITPDDGRNYRHMVKRAQRL